MENTSFCDRQFDPTQQNLDIDWLIKNGWTISGNLALRHILHEYIISDSVPCRERIEQIILQYDAIKQTEKIIQALKEMIELTNFFREYIANLPHPHKS